VHAFEDFGFEPIVQAHVQLEAKRGYTAQLYLSVFISAKRLGPLNDELCHKTLHADFEPPHFRVMRDSLVPVSEIHWTE